MKSKMKISYKTFPDRKDEERTGKQPELFWYRHLRRKKEGQYTDRDAAAFAVKSKKRDFPNGVEPRFKIAMIYPPTGFQQLACKALKTSRRVLFFKQLAVEFQPLLFQTVQRSF